MQDAIHMADKKDRTFQMRTTDDFLAKMDEFCAAHRPIKSRAEAIHQLAEEAYERWLRKQNRSRSSQ